MEKRLPSKTLSANSALKRITRISALCFISLVSGLTGFGQSQMIKDIDTTESPLRIEYRGLTVDNSGNLYFINLGKELWKSNTNQNPQKPVRLRALRSVSQITVAGNNVFFVGEDGAGRELWKTNGTGATTRKVKEIRPGAAGSNPSKLTNINGILYFTADDGAGGIELWKSDGTDAGTVRLKDIYPGAGSSNPSWITNVNGLVYFTAEDPTRGTELWKTDGTSAGTANVRDINPGVAGSDPKMLTNLNGTLFFSAEDNLTGHELWKSHGTHSTTRLVKDIYPGSSSSELANLTAMGDFVYFSASDGVSGFEIWKSKGTPTTTTMLTDWDLEYPTSFSQFQVVENMLYFFAPRSDDGYHYQILYSTDGTADHTYEELRSTDAQDLNITKLNDEYYFLEVRWNEEVYAPFLHLYKLGSYAAPVRTFRIFLDLFEENPENLRPELVSVNNALYFFAILNPDDGYKLLKSDGTYEGTEVLIDTYQPTESSNPSLFTPAENGVTFFRSERYIRSIPNGKGGREAVWRTDGTSEGTFMINEMERIWYIINVGELTYFGGIDETETWQLWVTDGTLTGTTLLKEIPEIRYASPQPAAAVNGILYFSAPYDGLWRSMGTPSTTLKLKDFRSVEFIGKGGGRAIFYVVTATGAHELWRSTGSINSTAKLKGIRQGGWAQRGPRTTVNDIFYFVADDGVHGSEIWRSNGTTSGTYLMQDLRTNDPNSWDILSMAAHNDTLYFSAKGNSGQNVLYKSSGTGAGTSPIKEVGSIYGYMSYGNQLLFLDKKPSSDESYELWSTNGSSAGTSLVKVINEEAGSDLDYRLIDNVIYFVVDNFKNIWRTDGTACGTFPNETASRPYPLTSIGTDLIFGASDPFYGKELHRLSTLALPGSPCGEPALQASSISNSSTINSGNLVAYAPNPFTDALVFKVKGSEGARVTVSVKTFTGEVVETFSEIKPNTDYTVGSTWPKGIYLLHVTINGKAESVRVIKR